MSPGTAIPALALAAFGSPVAQRVSTIAATTGSDLGASPGSSAAASGPPAAAATPHTPAALATAPPAAVRGGNGPIMPDAVGPVQSPTLDDHPVSGEPDSAVPPTAVTTTPIGTGPTESPAPFGNPVASPAPTTAVANSSAALGIITATTGFDLEAAAGVLSAAASGPPAAAATPHAPAPANGTPAAVSGESLFEKEVPPTAVATTPVFTDIAGLAEAPALFSSPVASPESPTAVANSGVTLGAITDTTCASSGIATPGCSATTAAMPPAAVSGDKSAEPAVPETTIPEEPSGSLHSLARAGPHHSAMPVSTAGDAQAHPSDF